MVKIQTFGTKTRLKNNESLTFGREIETAIETIGAKSIGIEDIFPEYKEKLQIFDDSIVNISKSPYTDQMNEANKLRGDYHVAIIVEMKNAMRHYDKDKLAAAKRIKTLSDTFIGAQRRSFDDQTSFINNFLQALASDQYKEDATLLGLDPWITELKKVNELCSNLTLKRTKERSEKSVKGNTEMTRPVFEKAYAAIVEKLNALAMINGDEKYAELFAWWNSRIDHYRVVISNSLGAGMGGKTSIGITYPSKPTKEDPEDRPVIE
ncbi:DUF6261 family protein [Parabacteroides chongii]|uniref:DUF6261 family protein n=1 Tax=Parabacteroides chongii TaxID=2685834 RepID=UPI00240DAF5B|nr:DUF6261 family protein [Parabacteroides chongii]WFE84783.1 DUF6261 family protein [Parabacteroides chongii]